MTQQEEKKYKEGHFLGLGIAIGMSMGVALIMPFAVMNDMMAFVGLGPAFGMSIGVAIGSALEAKYKKEGKIIPYTEEEKAKQKKTGKRILFGGLGVLVILLIGLLVAYLVMQ